MEIGKARWPKELDSLVWLEKFVKVEIPKQVFFVGLVRFQRFALVPDDAN